MGVLELQLRDYRLTTAEILYHFPDYPRLLQSCIWQEYDLAPGYPVLRKFLDFWESNIEGRLHSVMVATVPLLKPAEIRLVDACFELH
jgi:uncharacterized protein Usg